MSPPFFHTLAPIYLAILGLVLDNTFSEHIYWDQASVLVQIGLLKSEKIPITGIEQTKKLVELSKKD